MNSDHFSRSRLFLVLLVCLLVLLFYQTQVHLLRNQSFIVLQVYLNGSSTRADIFVLLSLHLSIQGKMSLTQLYLLLSSATRCSIPPVDTNVSVSFVLFYCSGNCFYFILPRRLLLIKYYVKNVQLIIQSFSLLWSRFFIFLPFL